MTANLDQNTNCLEAHRNLSDGIYENDPCDGEHIHIYPPFQKHRKP